MLRRIRNWFSGDPRARAARNAAEAAFKAVCPDKVVARSELRAVEPDRYVVAVVIDPGHPYRGMPPYRLFAVAKDLGATEELPSTADSRYGLKGIK